MVTGPGDETGAAAAGRGRMRTSRAERDHAIEVLKDAFAQDRLDKDELDARVGQALTARTHAELAALIADIPAAAAAARPRSPARARTRKPVSERAVVWGVFTVFVAVALVAVTLAGGGEGTALGVAVLAASWALVLGGLLRLHSWLDQRAARTQLPPGTGPGPDGAGLEGQRHTATPPDRTLPGPRADQPGADARARGSRASRPGRPVPSRRGVQAPRQPRPLPGAA